MADGAGKIALGAGLMSFGQNLGQAITANERRKQSLEEIRQRFGQQMALLDRREEMLTAREDREYERGAPERNARLGLLSAQTDAARALAEDRRRPDAPRGGQNSSMFSRTDPKNFTVESVAKAERIAQETGDMAAARAALVPRDGNDGGMFDRGRVANDAMDSARDALGKNEFGETIPLSEQVPEFIERNPDIAKQAGIQPSDPPPVAARKLAEWETRSFMSDPNQGRSGLMGSGSPNVGYQDIVGDLNRLLAEPGQDNAFPPSAFDQWRN